MIICAMGYEIIELKKEIENLITEKDRLHDVITALDTEINELRRNDHADK